MAALNSTKIGRLKIVSKSLKSILNAVADWMKCIGLILSVKLFCCKKPTADLFKRYTIYFGLSMVYLWSTIYLVYLWSTIYLKLQHFRKVLRMERCINMRANPALFFRLYFSFFSHSNSNAKYII